MGTRSQSILTVAPPSTPGPRTYEHTCAARGRPGKRKCHGHPPSRLPHAPLLTVTRRASSTLYARSPAPRPPPPPSTRFQELRPHCHPRHLSAPPLTYRPPFYTDPSHASTRLASDSPDEQTATAVSTPKHSLSRETINSKLDTTSHSLLQTAIGQRSRPPRPSVVPSIQRHISFSPRGPTSTQDSSSPPVELYAANPTCISCFLFAAASTPAPPPVRHDGLADQPHRPRCAPSSRSCSGLIALPCLQMNPFPSPPPRRPPHSPSFAPAHNASSTPPSQGTVALRK